MPETIVETRNLTKRYGAFTALSDLNLSIEKGSIHGFIGPNGAGKTTTMRIIATLLDLNVKKDSFVEDLSRGMKQRLCLARTLVHEPDLLILDEPASGLDPRARIELRELLKELRNLGKTILVSSHILSELTEMCTHVAIIERGHLLISGKVEDILQAMQPAREIYVRVMSRAAQAIALLEKVQGVSSVQALPQGYRPGQTTQWPQAVLPP